jgi:hypothetical protein
MPILIPTTGVTINDLVPLVLDRLEESRTNPIFWDVPKEIVVFLVEAMNEATLITGEPEIRFDTSLKTKSQLTLPANQTVMTFSGDIPLFGMMRLESSGQVKKTTVWDMDRMLPGWENDTGDLPDFWFPIGLTQFGIHPQLVAPVTVIVSGIAEPVSTSRPYTGVEPCDFQSEFRESFVDYAAHIAGLKEGTKEFQDSIRVYDRFISRMAELGKFASRKGSLRFSRTMGAPASTTPVEIR